MFFFLTCPLKNKYLYYYISFKFTQAEPILFELSHAYCSARPKLKLKTKP